MSNILKSLNIQAKNVPFCNNIFNSRVNIERKSFNSIYWRHSNWTVCCLNTRGILTCVLKVPTSEKKDRNSHFQEKRIFSRYYENLLTNFATNKRHLSDSSGKNTSSIAQENIVTVPNILTLSRAILSPVLGYLVVTGSFEWALGIFIYAGITDWLDGWIARRWPSQRTVCGTVVDPIADKLLVIIFTSSLCSVSLLPVSLAALIIGKDVCMLAGGIVLRIQSLEKPGTIRKFFDFKMPSMEMKPLMISKINTALQITTLATSLAAPVFGFVGHPLLQMLWFSTGATTVSTAISYIFAKDAYEIKTTKKP